MLLKEVRVLTDLQVISESRDTGVMCIRGTFQRAEEANHNQRIYPKAVLENCVKNLSEKLAGRELVGELDHPADGVVKLQNASHLITKLEWKGNDLIGEAEILPTPAGQIAKSLINAGVKIGISSRGMGTLSESVKGPKIVNDDYKMITFDLVADPSTKGAYPSLAESRQHAIDFVENVIKPAISEKAFVARLKKTLNESKVAEFSEFEVLLEKNEKRVNRQLASKNIPAGERARIAAKRKAQEKYRFDSTPPKQPEKSEKAKKHDDNIAKIHKKLRQLGDERTKEGLDPQYESRRDAARAKLEEMCGPNKHGKKKLKKMVKETRVPLTLTSLYEQNLVNEGVPAFISAAGRGLARVGKKVGGALLKGVENLGASYVANTPDPVGRFFGKKIGAAYNSAKRGLRMKAALKKRNDPARRAEMDRRQLRHDRVRAVAAGRAKQRAAAQKAQEDLQKAKQDANLGMGNYD